MNQDFYNRIKNSTAHAQIRTENGNYIVDNQQFLEQLIFHSFDIKDKTHIKACSILEKAIDLKIEIALPYIDMICNDLHKIKNDCAIRPIARTILNLVYDNAKNKNYLSNNQIDIITEVCFDWLISDIRMASKVYAMHILTEFGKSQDWIYPELKQILEKDAGTQTTGYQSAAKKVLNKISRFS